MRTLDQIGPIFGLGETNSKDAERRSHWDTTDRWPLMASINIQAGILSLENTIG